MTLLLFPVCGAAQATEPTLTTLRLFTGYPDDGANPLGVVVMRGDGEIIGTTDAGGAKGGQWGGYGTVFFLTPPATSSGSWDEAVYSLTGSIGEQPNAGVTLGADGAIYGTTMPGSRVFEMTPPETAGGQLTVEVLAAGGPILTYPCSVLASASCLLGCGHRLRRRRGEHSLFAGLGTHTRDDTWLFRSGSNHRSQRKVTDGAMKQIANPGWSHLDPAVSGIRRGASNRDLNGL
jgi:hypothetical protein